MLLALQLLAAACAAAPPRSAAPTAQGPSPAPSPSGPGEWTFVSSPDLWNIDVGNLRRLDGYDGPNSTSPSWERGTRTVLGAIRDEQPSFLAVAGDTVMARWHQDHRGVFGPAIGADVATEKRRVRRAASFYYAAWWRRLAGLPAYVAVGDHELGDDYSWTDPSAVQTVPTHRAEFWEHFVAPLQRGRLAPGSRLVASWPRRRPTAYAIRHRNLLLVSVDTFTRTLPPEVDVRGGQLRWLRRVLARTDAEHVIVQGHAPVSEPSEARVSGRLRISGGTTGRFWKTLAEGGVDLYLAGEFHDVDVARPAGGPVQVVHGGILGFPRAQSLSYLVVEVAGPRLELTMKQLAISFPHGRTDGRRDPGLQLFQPGNPTTAAVREFTVSSTPATLGRMSIVGGRVEHATGVFGRAGR